MRSQHFPLRTAGAVLVIVSGLGLGFGVSRSRGADVPAPREQSPEAPLRVAQGPAEPARKVKVDSVPGVTVSGKHPLLIGVTFYENLEKGMHLDGPENDMLLMKELLTKRYGFPEANVRILSENAAADNLPTRKNIEREFKRLAEVVKPGEQVVVGMGGHGSLQPQSDKAAFPQPDGCDRIFLPRDVGKWDGDSGQVPNAIRGDEIGAWLRQIPEKKASLFVVLDACHSGSGVRAVDEEKNARSTPWPRADWKSPRQRWPGPPKSPPSASQAARGEETWRLRGLGPASAPAGRRGRSCTLASRRKRPWKNGCPSTRRTPSLTA